MQRLSGIDPMFIYSDTPETPMEIAYACVFDPASAEGGYTFERVREQSWSSAQADAPAAFPAPSGDGAAFGLDHPRWVDDPDFDLSNHLLPGCSSAGARWRRRSSRNMVAKVMEAGPLQPDQPPWEMHVIEGLADGRVGLIAKVHHSVVDGVAGAALMAELLDLDPRGEPLARLSRLRPALDDPALPCPRRPAWSTDIAVPGNRGQPGRPSRTWRRGHARGVGRTRRAAWHGCAAQRQTTGPLSIPLGRTRSSSIRSHSSPRPGRVLHPSWTCADRQSPARALQRHGERRRVGRVLGCATDPPHPLRPRRGQPAGGGGAGLCARPGRDLRD